MSSLHDANGDGVEADPCVTQYVPHELYSEWSDDVWVAKSEDNGSTWIQLQNLTATRRPTADINDSCVDSNGDQMDECGFGRTND